MTALPNKLSGWNNQLLVNQNEVDVGDAAGEGEARAQDEALACYRESMALANEQGALAFELRATASLSELLVRSGQRDEAVRIARELRQRLPDSLASADVRRVADIAAGNAASAHVPRVPE